ncbi:putative stigma-specific protein Stig1 [Helianthus annuus]|nr:putative stigma-specific protein Stig1 [Helianthus annuus]
MLIFTEISFGFHQHHPCMLCSYPCKFSYVSFGHWLLLLCLLVFGNLIASVSSVPTHSNFFRALSRGRQRVSWCQNDPDFCSNPEKNPWGGSVCCFGKFCKDVMADRNHCGGCGHVCGYEFVCCDGKCVDVRNDPRHCGGCFEGCSSPGRCAYAMCDYG